MKTHHDEAFAGFDEIVEALKGIQGVVCFELYPGVTKEVVKKEIIDRLKPDFTLDIEDYSYDAKTLEEKFYFNITDDRVFGKMSHHTIFDYYDSEQLKLAKSKIPSEGLYTALGQA